MLVALHGTHHLHSLLLVLVLHVGALKHTTEGAFPQLADHGVSVVEHQTLPHLQVTLLVVHALPGGQRSRPGLGWHRGALLLPGEILGAVATRWLAVVHA